MQLIACLHRGLLQTRSCLGTSKHISCSDLGLLVFAKLVQEKPRKNSKHITPRNSLRERYFRPAFISSQRLTTDICIRLARMSISEEMVSLRHFAITFQVGKSNRLTGSFNAVMPSY